MGLPSSIWSELAYYAKLSCRDVCARIEALPRELRDSIYASLVLEINIDHLVTLLRHGMTEKHPFRCQLDHLGPLILRELMEMWYAMTTFEFETQDYNYSNVSGLIWNPNSGPTRIIPDSKFWSLLTTDPFGSDCVPGKFMKYVSIKISHDDLKSLARRDRSLVLPPGSVQEIRSGTKCIVTFQMSCDSKGLIANTEIKESLERIFSRLAALGISTRLIANYEQVSIENLFMQSNNKVHDYALIFGLY